ncbi:winged helix-turn-helix transcriptional regulator [Mobilitalea sibirica]|uniref:Winged helix-turn-helix transcriptional regulator n=1 Tax=Mobilitalea sibirica TaxID=1462919 RepID=A0A8J7HDA4_9FIRM|nr:metalloregulator ArsR/SmtB family transcription factor [Mobilitalea sibirica]MBH1941842.1 winged helix-turn-helix transcriptional regulator [Mobilitalea sibirica]
MEKVHKEYSDLAELLKVLAHPVRLCIVRGLIMKGECNVSYMQSCLDAPQSTVSQHLQKLKSAGIIEGRREGLEIYYQVCNEKAFDIVNILFNNSNINEVD